MARLKNTTKMVLILTLFITSIVLLKIPRNSMTAQAASAETIQKEVLFISSYSESFITVPAQIKGLQSVFVGENVKLEIEYMDTKRFAAPENTQNFYESLNYKINNGPQYDAIVVADDAALQFALDYQQDLFFEKPILFFAINDKERATIADANPYMAGSIEETSLEENIAIAMMLQPKASKVAAIVDNTLTGQGDQKQFEEAVKSFPMLEPVILNVSKTDFEEFGKKLEGIETDTIVLFLSMNQDNTEEYLDLEKQFLFIQKHTKNPVYRASVGGVGAGLIGGKMLDYEEMGREAAKQTMEVLNGTAIDAIPLVDKTPYYYYFDYELIQKYKIDENLIPEDAVLLNKEVHPMEKYKNYIAAAGILFIFLMMLTVILVIDNIKRRKMQKSLTASHDELASIYEELSASEEELKEQYNIIEKNAKEVNSLYQKYNLAIKNTSSAVWELDFSTMNLEISNNFNTIVNQNIITNGNAFTIMDSFMDFEYRQKVVAEVNRLLDGKIDEINVQVQVMGMDKHKSWILIRGKSTEDTTDKIKKIAGIFLDITQMKEKEEYIEYLANHDYLTHLPNRMKFMSLLTEKLENEIKGAVLLFDIDDFKTINDTLGHVYGDELLIQIAKRLSAIKSDEITIARLGGDEFLILITEISNQKEVEKYIQQIQNAFRDCFSFEGIENYINFSMGITLFPRDSDNMSQLIMNADTAMYSAKHNGKNSCVYYHDDMKKVMKSKKEIELILRKAIKEDGFSLVYQPQVDTKSGEIVGFEALIRLKNYNLSPGVFIPIAEETSHIINIGRWVAKEAIHQLAKWRDKGFKEKVIAINYSSKQLRDNGYIDYLRQLLEEYQISSEFIEIEITEGILLENDTQTMMFLQELKKYGFRIALDDFGTGYSSLNYLTYIPVNKIKLDKSISDKFLGLEETEVMESLISLAHSLHLTITAEGIEEWDKFLKLKHSGCDYIQGYLFSKPLQVEEVEAIYNKNLLKN